MGRGPDRCAGVDGLERGFFVFGARFLGHGRVQFMGVEKPLLLESGVASQTW